MRKLWILIMYLGSITVVVPQEGKVGDVVPVGFRGFELGMEVETVKEKLTGDPYLNYRGEPDVSFQPDSQNFQIECEGFSFVDRAFFQFFDKKLYILTIVLDTKTLDHYTLFTSLVEKYGEFTSLTPAKVIWEFDSVAMSLERPLSIKYINTKVFGDIKDAGRAEQDLRSTAREKFLEGF